MAADDRLRTPVPGAGASLLVEPARTSRCGGRPLEPATRRRMEAKLGHDFGSVRVHDGSEAAAAAESIGAQAFTRGEDVVLGKGQRARAPLIAHELAHVVQQRRANTIEERVSQPGEPSEALADAGRTEPLASVPAVQRQPAPGAPPDFKLKPSPWFQRSMGHLVIDDFPLGKSTLTQGQMDQIKFHASILKTLLDSEPGSRVYVTGHGDAVGTDERNVEIGTERAEAVVAELVKAGIAKELVDTDSAGKSSPAVTSKGAEGQNRRAVIGFSPPLRLPGFQTPQLTPPTLDLTPRPKPNFDIGPSTKPRFEPLPGVGTKPDKPGPRRDEEPPTFDWKRAEDMIRRAQEIEKNLPKSRSPLERLADAAVETLDPLIKKLPISDDLKKKARQAIRDGVEAGSVKACETGVDAVGLPGEAAEGAKAVCKGLLKSKPGGSK
ncbi:MAG: eCIS core domain-containing protein [Actinomycetota bacterium]